MWGIRISHGAERDRSHDRFPVIFSDRAHARPSRQMPVSHFLAPTQVVPGLSRSPVFIRGLLKDFLGVAAPEVEVHRKEANALRDFCVFLESSDHASRRHARSRAIDAPCDLGQASAGNTRANFNTSESTNRITVSKKRPINHDDGSSLCPRL